MAPVYKKLLQILFFTCVWVSHKCRMNSLLLFTWHISFETCGTNFLKMFFKQSLLTDQVTVSQMFWVRFAKNVVLAFRQSSVNINQQLVGSWVLWNFILFRYRLLKKCFELESQCSGEVGQLLVPVDWIFLPLVELYNNAINL